MHIRAELTVHTRTYAHRPQGVCSSGLHTNYPPHTRTYRGLVPTSPPPLTVGQRLPGGGGGRGDGGGSGGFCGGGGWGASGTSEQLGMRPRCDPTFRTAPCRNKG